MFTVLYYRKVKVHLIFKTVKLLALEQSIMNKHNVIDVLNWIRSDAFLIVFSLQSFLFFLTGTYLIFIFKM